MSESHPDQGAADVTNELDPDKSTECRYCDRNFDTYMGRRKHEGLVHNEPYQDESTLRRLYFDEGLSMAEIADRLDTNPPTIYYWISKHGIETRDVQHHQARVGAKYRFDRGYMAWSSYNGENNDHVRVHRLLAVSKYGFDALRGKVVHHKNGIPWDNRHDNIDLMTRSEHAKHHHGTDLTTGEER